MNTDTLVYKNWRLIFTGWKGSPEDPYLSAQWFGEPAGEGSIDRDLMRPFAAYPGGRGWFCFKDGFPPAKGTAKNGQMYIKDPESCAAEMGKYDSLRRLLQAIDYGAPSATGQPVEAA
jgi:hypothetical protein